MEILKIKNQLIKEVLTPYFEKRGFKKIGLKYFANMNHLMFQAEIQSQRYYQDEVKEKIRIRLTIFQEIEKSHALEIYKFENIETSWFEISENMFTYKINVLFKNVLSELSPFLNDYMDFKKSIKRMKEKIKRFESNIESFDIALKSNPNVAAEVFKDIIKGLIEEIEIINN